MNSNDRPHRNLSNFDLVCLVVGTVIGAGIFKAPSVVAGQLSSGMDFLLIWVVGGLISVIGALCYAELASGWPHAGGEYHFLSKAYGKHTAYFYGWARSTVIVTGSMAILAITLGDYMTTLVDLGPYSTYSWAMMAIVLLGCINLLGIRESKRIQNALAILEVCGVLAIIVAGFKEGGGLSIVAVMHRDPHASNYGLALIFVLLTFGGWNEAAYLSAEAKDAKFGIANSLLWGLCLVTLLFFLTNFAYFAAMGLDGIATSNAVASDIFLKAYGKKSAAFFSAIVVFSCLNSLNATILFGARSAYALGQDFRSFAWIGRWHASGNPRNSLILQMFLALTVVGLAILTRQGFEAVVEFTAPVFWTFIFLVGVAVIVLRWRYPEVDRPFKVPLYPFLPVVFILVTGWMLWSSLMYAGAGAWVGVAVLACGLLPLAWERLYHGPSEEHES